MDDYLINRIENIKETDFWASFRVNRRTSAAVNAGLSMRRAHAYRLLGNYHAESLASEAQFFADSIRKNVEREALKRSADRVLRHEIQGWHTQVRKFGPIIDFNADFGQSGQYGFHYLKWLAPVMRQYVLSGSAKYRDCFTDIIKQYYDQRAKIIRRIPGLHPVYYELGAWAKATLILPAYAFLAGDPAVGADVREAMLKLLLGFARSLYCIQKGGYRPGNWQIVGCQSLYAIGAAFPEFRDSAGWRRRAEDILDEHARNDFFADGGHHERCWGYGHMSLHAMSLFYQSALRHGYMDARRAAKWRSFLMRGYKWFATASAPGLMTLNYGDGGIASAQPMLDEALDLFPEKTYRGCEGNDGLSLPGTDRPAFCRTGLQDLSRSSSRAVSVLPEHPDIKRKAGALGVDLSRSDILRPSGYVFMRGGGSAAPFMSVNFGRFGGWHTHDDLLDFTLWCFGMPLIEEVGRFESYDNPLTPMFRAAESHNQIILNHVAMNRDKHEAHDVRWHSTPEYDLFSGWHDAFTRARIQRQIVFLKPDGWLVYDVITADEYIFQAASCLHGIRSFRSVSRGLWLLSGRPSCCVAFAEPDDIRRVETSVDYNRSDYGELTKTTPAYQHERHRLKILKWRDIGDKRPISFAMLLVPFENKMPPVSLRRRPVGGDVSNRAAAFEVGLNSRNYSVVFNPARAPLLVGRRRCDSLMTVRRSRHAVVMP